MGSGDRDLFLCALRGVTNSYAKRQDFQLKSTTVAARNCFLVMLIISGLQKDPNILGDKDLNDGVISEGG